MPHSRMQLKTLSALMGTSFLCLPPFSYAQRDTAFVIFEKQTEAQEPSAFTKTMLVDPEPPNDPGRYIGHTAYHTETCYPISNGPTPGNADVTWTWTYQNTRDSDGDGDKDSDPQWVLTDVRMNNVEWYTEGSVLTC